MYIMQCAGASNALDCLHLGSKHYFPGGAYFEIKYRCFARRLKKIPKKKMQFKEKVVGRRKKKST